MTLRVSVVEPDRHRRPTLVHCLRADDSIEIVEPGDRPAGHEDEGSAVAGEPDCIVIDAGALFASESAGVLRGDVPLVVLSDGGESPEWLVSKHRAVVLRDDTDPDDLPLLVRLVAKGYALQSGSIFDELRPSGPILSERQVAILRRIARSRCRREIAKELSLSESTVKREIRKVRDWFGLENGPELHAFASKIARAPEWRDGRQN